MLVLKFGGTSVGSPERMQALVPLIHDAQPKIVVLSAMSGTTNALVEIGKALYARDNDLARKLIDSLEAKYKQVVKDLFATLDFGTKGNELIAEHFNYLRSFTIDMFTSNEEKAVLAQGELLSTALVQFYLEESGIRSALLPALNFMRIDENEEPDLNYIETHLKAELEKHRGVPLFITQGYICRNSFGEIDNLKRGGSDYTATLIGAALRSTEVQIWTDIDGMHNNDPRIVKRTFPIRELTFEEAAELAYFGAKILHPSTITPAKLRGVPVRLKNTMEPKAFGTLIATTTTDREIKAIAAKDGLTAIYIHSTRMLNAFGFLKKVFDIFEKYKTPVDMITTSEVSVAVTIDNDTHLNEITADLSEIADLEEHDRDLSIICIVGDFKADKEGIALKVFEAMKHIPIRMISYGASEHNLSILVWTKDKAEALNVLNERLFYYEDAMKTIFNAQ